MENRAVVNAMSMMLSDCLKKTMAFDNLGEPWSVVEADTLKLDDCSQFSMLTISSFKFKTISLLHFSDDDWMHCYVQRCLNLKPEELTHSKFFDYINETANNFSGLIKRALYDVNKNLGMSTPNILQGNCMDFMNWSEDGDQVHAQALLNGHVAFNASMYLFTSDGISLREIEQWRPVEDNTVSGELEFL